MYFFVSALLVLVFILALFIPLFNHRRKKQICKKLCALSCEEKCRLVSDIIQPLGYCYIPRQDIFSTAVDAPQRSFGYTARFDRYAPYFNMVFDCLPVYFDYDGHTWLIEFWKGQYGINLGCEAGIYQADSLVTSAQQNRARFHSVEDAKMLPMSIRLYRHNTQLARLCAKHWWLTAFDMGLFANPEELSMDIQITFPNRRMLSAFVNALEADGRCRHHACGLRVTVRFAYCSSCALPFLKKLLCRFKQWENRLQCRLFRRLTKPFTTSLDRLLCLYFYLPFMFRRLIGGRERRKCHRKCKRL